MESGNKKAGNKKARKYRYASEPEPMRRRHPGVAGTREKKRTGEYVAACPLAVAMK
jgi:hypothetical protein